MTGLLRFQCKGHLIKRFFSKLKHFCRVATRFDKRAANCLAMVQLDPVSDCAAVGMCLAVVAPPLKA